MMAIPLRLHVVLKAVVVFSTHENESVFIVSYSKGRYELAEL